LVQFTPVCGYGTLAMPRRMLFQCFEADESIEGRGLSDMMDLTERDAEILRFRKEHATYKEIGQKFQISTERVRQIVCRLESETKRKDRSGELRSVFRAANEIGKMWPADFILDALLLQGRPRWSAQRFMENRHMTEASLRNLMDFLIADTIELPFNRLQAMPAYRQKDLGIKTYSALVDHLSGLDLGDAFNTEWAKRVKNLIRHLSSSGQYVPRLLRKYA
jgi:hypothetical protein